MKSKFNFKKCLAITVSVLGLNIAGVGAATELPDDSVTCEVHDAAEKIDVSENKSKIQSIIEDIKEGRNLIKKLDEVMSLPDLVISVATKVKDLELNLENIPLNLDSESIEMHKELKAVTEEVRLYFEKLAELRNSGKIDESMKALTEIKLYTIFMDLITM